MSTQYKHADAREGIRELVAEFGKARNRLKSTNVLYLAHSMKFILLIAAGCEPPRVALIRPYKESTVGYTTQTPCNNPAFDNQVEVVRTGNGQLYFREEGHLLTASEFAANLISLVAAEPEPVP